MPIKKQRVIWHLINSELTIIKTLVKLGESNVADLAIAINKDRTQVSRLLNKLLDDKIVYDRLRDTGINLSDVKFHGT